MADINKTWQTAFQPLRTERARLDRHSAARARAVNERRAAPAPRAGAARTAAMSAGWRRGARCRRWPGRPCHSG